ncbi:UNVERIFIED_ORG: hypothetical protein E4P37_19170 [Bacillus sp. AZ43]
MLALGLGFAIADPLAGDMGPGTVGGHGAGGSWAGEDSVSRAQRPAGSPPLGALPPPPATPSADPAPPSGASSPEVLAAIASASALGLPDHSGLGWRSGVYHPGSRADRYAAFGDWRGRPLDVVVDWPARQTWDDIVNPA